jgi:uncharacterized protein (TIGR03435 family)
MTRSLFGIAFVALSFAVALTPAASAQEKFEAADVHKSPQSPSTVMRTAMRGGRYELTNATMVDLIRTAYSVEPEDVYGGPSWVEFDRFDVIAKATASTPPEDLKTMLKALLADRFKLIVHDDMKPLPGYVLTLGKAKHKLKEADPAGMAGCQTQNPANIITSVGGQIRAAEPITVCRNVTMEAFVKDLRRIGAGYFTSAVINATELKGAWDFDLKVSPKTLVQLVGGDAVTIFDAVDKQLGLKLEERTMPRPVLVIDQVNRMPTDNPPDIEAKIPALPPAEFEVATLKPQDPTQFRLPAGATFGIQPGGRVTLPPVSIRTLITLAWSVNLVNALGNDEIPGLPKAMESTPYELVAKVPVEYAPATGTGSIQDLAPFLQNLLVERFKMKSHFEDRQVTAYKLTAAKPKLKKADPATRTGCKSSTSGGVILINGSSPPSSQINCQNITMAEFADYLQGVASTYVRYPVVDGTGLEGSWDFSFSFSSINPFGGGAEASGGATDPIGGLTIFDALEKQLGLKLEQEKRAYPVFVIDHIEEKPIEN